MNCLHRLVWFGKNTESVFVMNSYLTIMDISDDKAVDFQLAHFIFSAISLWKKKAERLHFFLLFFPVYKAPALIALFFPMLLSIIWLTRRLSVPSICPATPLVLTDIVWRYLIRILSPFAWLFGWSVCHGIFFCIFVITLVHLSKIHHCHMASVLSLCLLPILL